MGEGGKASRRLSELNDNRKSLLSDDELLYDSLCSLSSSSHECSNWTRDGHDTTTITAVKVVGRGDIWVWVEPRSDGDDDVDDLPRTRENS